MTSIWGDSPHHSQQSCSWEEHLGKYLFSFCSVEASYSIFCRNSQETAGALKKSRNEKQQIFLIYIKIISDCSPEATVTE